MKAIHKVTDVIRLGLQSLTAHRVRSVLTAIGILFGVWSVIAMLAINEGAARTSREELAKLGSENLILRSIKPIQRSRDTGQTGRVANYGLTHADISRLRDNVPGVVRCTIAHTSPQDAIVPSKLITVTMLGVEPAFYRSARLILTDKRSRFITHADVLRRRNVCVMTADLAKRLFSPEDPIGNSVRLGAQAFVVVGITAQGTQIDVGAEGASSADQVYIPISTDRQRFGDITIRLSEGAFSFEQVDVSLAILQMTDEQAVLKAAKIVPHLLKRFHDRQDYDIRIPLAEIEQQKAQQKLWNYMFFAIAAVSLIVGGIGIMNIMLASVTERTREIGVRRALGAKKRDIVAQFLVESVTLTTIGGLLGILVGALGVPLVVRWVLKMQAIVEWPTLVVPFSMAMLVGLGSGIYPAVRAAALDPIVALRHE